MFIQTEDTPNPQAMKFLPGVSVLPEGSRPVEIFSRATARVSPLAEALFAIDGIQGVFLGADFLTVTKAEAARWEAVRPQVLALVMNHFVAGLPVLAPAESLEEAEEEGEDSDVVRQIKEIIEAQIRPALANDGGDVAFRAFEEGIVYLRLKGACAGCPSATMTLKRGIESLLKRYVPEVQEVRQVF